MDRTDEFFQFFSEFNSIGSAAKVLEKSNHNYFHETSSKIAKLLQSINRSIKDTKESFIDKYGIVLAMKHDMSDDERMIFVEQTQVSIQQAQKLINQLAENIKSGKMRLKGNAIDHAIGVLKCLDLSLDKIKRSFALMQAKREQVKIQITSINAKPPPIAITNPTKNENNQTRNNIQIDSNFQQQLEQEHSSILQELLDFHDQITQTERMAEEIAQLTKTFNELMVEQTEKIRVIRSEVEKATDDYESGTKEVKKSIDSSKYQHLWMSLIILFLSFMLLFKYY